MSAQILPARRWLIRCGDFFFKYRNFVFPAFVVLAAVTVRPRYWMSEEWDDVLDLAGIAVALAGQSFRAMVIGLAYIKRGGLEKKVYAETLVTGGLFSASRNPLYFGNALILAGLMLIFNDAILYVAASVFFGFAYWAILRTEETFLLAKFGPAYAAYCGDVNRWWPDPRRVLAATRGARFNWRRVVMKDYGTAAGWIVAALAIEAYEEAAEAFGSIFAAVAPYAGEILLVVACALLVRQAKKSGLLTENG